MGSEMCIRDSAAPWSLLLWSSLLWSPWVSSFGAGESFASFELVASVPFASFAPLPDVVSFDPPESFVSFADVAFRASPLPEELEEDVLGLVDPLPPVRGGAGAILLAGGAEVAPPLEEEPENGAQEPLLLGSPFSKYRRQAGSTEAGSWSNCSRISSTSHSLAPKSVVVSLPVSYTHLTLPTKRIV